MIVFADADLDAAADPLMANKFRGGGQTCVCTAPGAGAAGGARGLHRQRPHPGAPPFGDMKQPGFGHGLVGLLELVEPQALAERQQPCAARRLARSAPGVDN